MLHDERAHLSTSSRARYLPKIKLIEVVLTSYNYIYVCNKSLRSYVHMSSVSSVLVEAAHVRANAAKLRPWGWIGSGSARR